MVISTVLENIIITKMFIMMETGREIKNKDLGFLNHLKDNMLVNGKMIKKMEKEFFV